jgi:CHAD domain-containing protein
MSLEREVKLQAPAAFRLSALEGSWLLVEREPEPLVTTYLDTADLRIARWGCSLRQRRGQGWTVKLPPSEDGSLLVRPEIVFEGEDPARPPAAAVDLLRAYVRDASLAPVARLRTMRRGVDVNDELGRPLAVITDDEVSVMDGRRVASRFRELEVELVPSAPAEVVGDLLARLREAGAGEVDNVPKLRRALGSRALEPPEIEVPDLGKTPIVAEVVRRSLAASAVRLLRHDAGVRIGEDPEDVHQARVATRRIRSDLRTFRGQMDPPWTSRLREELRWLGGELGAVRDAEVLRDRIRARASVVPAGDRRALDRLVAGLDARRIAARERLLSSMAEGRYVRLLDTLVDAARAPALLPEVGDAPAAVALAPTMDAPWKHLQAAVERALEDPSDETLHATRIRAKRVRYAAEALAPVFGKRARRFAEAAVALQDVLGEHQDAVVAGAWLREAAASTPSLAFVAGELVAIEAEAARHARAIWPVAWRALARKKLRFWT